MNELEGEQKLKKKNYEYLFGLFFNIITFTMVCVTGWFFSNKLVAYILVIETHFVNLVFPFGQFIFLEFCITYVRQIRY